MVLPLLLPSLIADLIVTDWAELSRGRSSGTIFCAAPCQSPRRQDLWSCGFSSAATLRRLREARGITAQQAAEAIRGSDSKISRIELGRHAAREIDVSDLLTLYGVTELAEREPLLLLASQALAQPWWRGYTAILPPWFQSYLGVEEAAESVQSYDTHFVPGLLQTAEYAGGLLAHASFGAEETRGLLDIRAKRIERFAAGGWRFTAVIDEAVLHRPVGGKTAFEAQLEHLRDAAGWPGVTVRVRPFTAGRATESCWLHDLALRQPGAPRRRLLRAADQCELRGQTGRCGPLRRDDGRTAWQQQAGQTDKGDHRGRAEGAQSARRCRVQTRASVPNLKLPGRGGDQLS